MELAAGGNEVSRLINEEFPKKKPLDHASV